MPVAKTLALGATDVMSAYLDGRLENSVLIGSDEEPAQWVAVIGAAGLTLWPARQMGLRGTP